MFTIYNFEDHIPAKIVQRGEEYYQNGCVKKLKEAQKGLWQAKVTGSEKYDVDIDLKDNSIVEGYFCDCPYDGDICKHVVAVLYQLGDKLTVDVTPVAPAKKNSQKPKKATLASLAGQITLEEYRDFIQHYASANKSFKTDFELYFAHKDKNFDIGTAYADAIKKLVKKYSRHGYMDYRDTKMLANEIRLMAKTACDYFAKDNFMDALALAKAIIREATQVIEYSDDSSGILSDALYNTIGLLDEMAAHRAVPYPVKEQIAGFLEEELGNSLYFDYGNFGLNMANVFFGVSITTGRHDAFLAFTDRKITEKRYTDFYNDHYTQVKISFLKAIGKDKEAELLTSRNMDIPDIRMAEVNKQIESVEYAKAKALIEEGIAIAEKKDHPGTVTKWHKELLRIAVLENDIDRIRRYAKTFAFPRYSFDPAYYNQWKQTYHQKEWPGIIEHHIQGKIKEAVAAHDKVKADFLHREPSLELLDMLAPIYIQENYLERLLELLRKEASLENILQYHSCLGAGYSAALLELYLPAFESYCDEAVNRSSYRNLAAIMKQTIKSIPDGKDAIKEMAQKLMKKYPRRPALREELTGV